MRTIFSLIAFALQYADFANFNVIPVPKCPCQKHEWLEHEKKMACNGKLYTCIETRNGTLIECCILPYKFDENDMGCPFVEKITDTDGPLIGVKHTDCNVPGCPQQDHGEYYINELYKYPACLIPVRQRQSIKTMADFDFLCPTSPNAGDKPDSSSTVPVEKEYQSIYTPVIFIVIPFLVIISSIPIILILRRRSTICKKNIEGGKYLYHQEYCNYATGLAWSHYTGFLIKLLPEFEGTLKESATYKENPKSTFEKWIMLCPKSGKSSKILDDPNITLVESLSIPGIKPKIEVYKIQKDERCQPWYCCIEFPSSLMSLGKEPGVISEEIIALEVKRFSFYIMNILNHEKNSECKGKAIALFYDDDEKEMTGRISTVVHEHIDWTQKLNENKSELQDVCILHTGLKSRHTRGKFLDFEKAVSTKCDPSILDLKNDDQRIILKIMNQSRWIVLYGIDEDIYSELEWLLKSMAKHIQEGKCNIIAVFSGVNQENVARYIPWTVAIDIDKEIHSADKVNRIIYGDTVELTSDIVIGDLSFGLTWAFYVNYLKHVTSGLYDRMLEAVEDECKKMSFRSDSASILLSKCFWQIIPANCKFVTLDGFDEKLSTPIPVKPLKTQLFEAQRVFPCFLYSFKRSDTIYYFVGEVFAPCKVLSAMKDSNIVRLSDKNVKKQRSRLRSQMNSLLQTVEQTETSNFKIKVISFNDRGKKNLSERLFELMESELKIDVSDKFGYVKKVYSAKEGIPLLSISKDNTRGNTNERKHHIRV